MLKALKPKLFLRSLSGQFTITHLLSTFTIILLMLIANYIFFYANGIMSVRREVAALEQKLNNYSQSHKSQNGLRAFAAISSAIDFIRATSNNSLILTNSEGIILDATKKEFTQASSLFNKLTPAEQESLKTALNGQSTYTNSSLKKFNLFDSLIIAAPLKNTRNEVLGAIVIWTKPVTISEFLLDFMRSFITTFVIFALFAIPLIISVSRKQGTIFATRLEHLAFIAKNWAKGDLSQTVVDDNQDELAELSQNLNSMAQQFNTLLENKLELATVKERNRLAIELHDSVKQQIFSIGLKAATLENKINDQKSQVELAKIQTMVQNIKEELNRVILELKPIELEHNQFTAALHHYASTWSQNHNIAVQINQKGSRKLPFEYEQSFFRISQEALNNVLKHSSANFVEIDIDFQNAFNLKIKDNGKGFDQNNIKAEGLGLKIMKERIEKLGGQFQLSSSTQGTVIEICCFANSEKLLGL